jgi:RHS repeat-associated protein
VQLIKIALFLLKNKNYENFYLLRDYQGSILAVVNQAGTVVEKRLYDAWGDILKVQDGAGNTLPKLTFFDRGYTGHEHLQSVGLIHMNGRLYDSKLHRFLQPDNYVQEPENTQNYNRYAYCVNNPMLYVDKSGELFSFFVGLFEGLANVATHGVNFHNYDWDKTTNAFKIDMGLFKGNFGQIVSRFTWELPQNTLGYLYNHSINIAGHVDNVSYYENITVVKTFGDILPHTSKGNGVTLGSYITGNRTIEAYPNNSLFQHEYGHYLQSKKYGLAYLSRFAFPSLYGREDVENDANARSFTHFYGKLGNNLEWDFFNNVIGNNKNWNINSYNNPAFQLALSNSLLSPSWFDYFFGISPITGLINSN